MNTSYIFRAWTWLLAHLLIAASTGFAVTLLLAFFGDLSLGTLLKATRLGLPHVGLMVKNLGSSFGVHEWLLFFLCNLAVALLNIVPAYWARLLNPHDQSRSFLRLRRRLQRDRSAELLRKIPFFARIKSPQLRLVSFLLLGVPYIATLALGLIVGALLGVALLMSPSPLVALAYLMPHGIPEISALLLACSIPVGIWIAIRPVVEQDASPAVFRQIDTVLASRQFQANLKMIINLLLIAGLTEAYFTSSVVAMFSNG